MAVTPDQVIERIFTTANPHTGSAPPAEMAWVVFAHGTCFFTAPSDELASDASLDAIADAARAALRELGPVNAGSPSADFNPIRLDGWFPDEPVWFVAFDHPAVATIVIDDLEPVVAGITARISRDLDHDEQAITHVRGFGGQVRTA